MSYDEVAMCERYTVACHFESTVFRLFDRETGTMVAERAISAEVEEQVFTTPYMHIVGKIPLCQSYGICWGLFVWELTTRSHRHMLRIIKRGSDEFTSMIDSGQWRRIYMLYCAPFF